MKVLVMIATTIAVGTAAVTTVNKTWPPVPIEKSAAEAGPIAPVIETAPSADAVVSVTDEERKALSEPLPAELGPKIDVETPRLLLALLETLEANAKHDNATPSETQL